MRDILWSKILWTNGFYANTVGLYASNDTIVRYIRNQGKIEKYYKKIYESQLELDFGN